MTRGEGPITKVCYKGKDDHFIVVAESAGAVEKYRKDPSTPLVDVVNGFNVFCTHKQGSQGTMDTASKASLENEFGTSNVDECVKRVIKEGNVLTGSSGRERQGTTNMNNTSLGSTGYPN